MRKIITLYIILSAIMLQGCIKEDMEDCYTTIYFSYIGDGTQEIFPEKIGKVNLYVYNENGDFVQKIVLDKEDLNKQQGITLNLPSGKYQLVCWGNSYADTQINDDTGLNTGVLAAPNYFTKIPIATNDSLYYGSREIDFVKDANRTDTVKFSSSHIKMLIELTGLDGLETEENESPLDIEIRNLKPMVNFHKIFSGENVTYYPFSTYNSITRDFDSKFNVLRFNDDNDIYINLVNKETNNIIYTLPLKDFMEENKITVNNKNEVLIGIRFRFNGTSITVKPWDEETITPGI